MEEVTIFQKQRWGHSVSKRAHRIIKAVNSSGSSGSRRHSNKQDLRASGFSLLPLALRPGLLLVGEKNDAKSITKSNIKSNTFKNIVLRNFVLLIVIFIASFVIQNSYTNNVSATSLTLTIPNNISLDINPSSNNGLSKSDKSTLSVKTDANYGYNLSIKVKDNTNSNSLVNGTSKLVSIGSPLSESDFSSSAASNTWGYLPSKFNSNDNTNFQPGPTDSDSTLDKTSSPNAETTNNYDITLGVKTDNNLMSGTYKNTFVLTASANTVSYTITYNLNSGSWNGTSPQTGTTSETSVSISSITPTKSGYSFEGWCSVAVTNNDSAAPTCSGTKYSVNETYNLNNGTNSLSLYAMWKSTVTYRSYTINYINEVGSTPSLMPTTTTGRASSTNDFRINLDWRTPTLEHYNFKGWCDIYLDDNDYSSCPSYGNVYQPNASWTVYRDGATIDLHALWEVKDDLPSCSISSGYFGTSYTGAAKSVAGLCWMWEDYKTEITYTEASTSCPRNWHVPTKDEMESLVNYFGGEQSTYLYDAGWGRTKCAYWTSTPGICPNGKNECNYFMCPSRPWSLSYTTRTYLDTLGLSNKFVLRCVGQSST